MSMEDFEKEFSITDSEDMLKKEVVSILANANLDDPFVDWHQLEKYIRYVK